MTDATSRCRPIESQLFTSALLIANVLFATTVAATPVDRLVVRSRAGIQPHARHRVLEDHGGREVTSVGALGATVIEVPHGQAAGVAAALRRSGYFKSVELEHRAAATQTANDPNFPSQWGLATIGAPAAWDVSVGSSAVTVAIVDSGIDATHPDLQAQVLPGYDFVNNDSDASDDNGHGTRMAGIVAAQTFNAIGVAGVCPNCTLLPVKVLGADGTGAYSTIASGITYAADHGARIISLSLAGTAASDLLQSAVDYATARGAVVVAAAGNYGANEAVYPAACANAVAVGATDSTDTVAGFSDWGSWLSLAAPGVNIVTTNWSASGSPAYVASSGTSPATAFVSGGLGLLLSARPDLSSPAAVSILTAAAHDVGSAGWDPYTGWGRLDVATALGAPAAPPTAPVPDTQPPRVSILSPASGSLVFGTATVDVSASDDVGVTSVDLLVDNVTIATDTAPPFSFSWDTTAVSAGRHVLSARAVDAAGNARLSSFVVVQVTPGVGLMVKRSRIALPRRVGAPATLTLSAVFSLPPGTTLDQGSNSFTAVLTSSKGTITSTMPQPGAFSAALRGRSQFVVSTTDGSGGVLKVAIVHPKGQPIYNLLLSATAVNLANVDPVMNLAVTINGATLSESTTFRITKTAFVSP